VVALPRFRLDWAALGYDSRFWPGHRIKVL
jgi:hypothetical protein